MLTTPGHDVTIGLIERAYHADRSLVPRILDAPELPAAWVSWADRIVGRDS
jgi:hypothetical protein